MYEKLGSLVSRRWVAVIFVWIFGAALIAPKFQREVLHFKFTPTWDEVTKDGDLAYLPARMTSVRGQLLYGQAFPENKSRSEIVVVLERKEGLQQADLDLAKQVADFFEGEKAKVAELTAKGEARPPSVLAVVDVLRPAGNLEGAVNNGADDLIGKKLISPDKQAVIVVASLEHELIAVDSAWAIDIVKKMMSDKVAEAEARTESPLPTGLNWGLTGSAAVGGDTLASSNESIQNIHKATAVLVVLILLVVYQAPVLVFIPLVTIGVAVFTANHIIALLTQLHNVPGFGWWEFEIFKTSEIFIFTICFGSGTDFCLFLISRFREEIERGHDQATALKEAVGQVGEALVGSALTTVCGLGMMYFSDFGKFTYSGPAIALCLIVTLIACMTLAPALLRMFGRYVFWPFGVKSKPCVEDDTVEKTLVGRFWTWASDRIMAYPGLILLVSLTALSPLAYAGLDVKVSYDLLADLEAQRPSKVGTRMMQAHFPAGEMGPITMLVEKDFFPPSDQQISAFVKDKFNGTTLDAAATETLAKIWEQTDVVKQLDAVNKFVADHAAAGLTPQTVDALKRIAVARKDRATLEKTVETLKSRGEFSDDVAALVDVNSKGFDSDVGRQLITDLTKRIYDRFPKRVTSVRSLTYPLGEEPPVRKKGVGLRGFLTKTTVSHHDQSKAKYVATTGPRAHQVARFDIVSAFDPFSVDAEELLGSLDQDKRRVTPNVEDFVQKELAGDQNSPWHGATFDFIGTTAGTRDLKAVITSDERVIQRLVVIAVSVVVLSILRRPLICGYLIFTVVFSYLVTIGATELVFSMMYPGFEGLDWKVPIFLFVILVAVGEDYNIYLATRVFEEERRLGRTAGLRTAIIKTGGIITSCGVIMAGTFVSLMSGSLRAMHALGFALTLGVILDTFIVRPVLVPAFLAWLYKVMPERAGATVDVAEVEAIGGVPVPPPAAAGGSGILEPLTMPGKPHTEMASSRRPVKR